MRGGWSGRPTTVTAMVVKFIMVNLIIAIATWSLLVIFYGV